MLEPFGPEIWIAGGGTVEGLAGFRFPTRMAVIRLAGGGLFVCSPVALTEGMREAVDALGPVAVIVAPNDLHHLFLAQWQAVYPGAQVHAAPGVAAKQPGVTIVAELGDAPAAAWAGQIDQLLVAGHRITQEVVFFHRASGTVLFTDLLQNLPAGWFTGWRAGVARLDLMTGAEPAVPRKFRLGFAGRPKARAALRQVLDWPAQRVLMAHGTPVTGDAPGLLRRAFSWMGD